MMKSAVSLAAAMLVGGGGLNCCCMSFGMLIGLALMGFWIWTIVEVATKEPAEDPNKIMWVLIVVLLGWIGGLIYLFVRRPERMRKYGR